MPELKVYEDSKNYTCQVIKLPAKVPVKGLDKLVQVTYQGNNVLVAADYDPDGLYLFFPAECKISDQFLHINNLYREANHNLDPSQKGYFDDNQRVKAQKFKGVISTGFIVPISFARGIVSEYDVKVGDEFNEFNGFEFCRKFIRVREPNSKGFSNPKVKVLDSIVESKLAPEHPDTAHLLKNAHRLGLEDKIIVSYKLHGTSARTYRTVTKRKLSWFEKIAKYFGAMVVEEEYNYVVGSRRVIKSVGFEELPNKHHFFTEGDLWSEVAKNNIQGKLNLGEAIYYEIVGKTYTGEEIQGGYSYGFDKPKIYVYRISNIGPDGIEIDLTYGQMKVRAAQLGLDICPEFFEGTVQEFILRYLPLKYGVINLADDRDIPQYFEEIFYNRLLEKPSIVDPSVIEEGFCVRVDMYPKPEIYKIKSRKFLEHETKALDKGVNNLEEEQTTNNEEPTSNS